MTAKEQLIDEIEEKSRILYEICSISQLEEVLYQIEKSIKKVKYIEKLFNKIGENNE